MSTISAIQAFTNAYANVAKTHQSASSTALTDNTNASSNVTISAAAREAANNDAGGYKLPDFVTKWFNKDFPQDVIDEAKARLAANKAGDGLGTGGPMNLPLLPENQALMDNLRQEMQNIHDAGWKNATPEQTERYNLLMNETMRLSIMGGQRAMTEADLQRELDISSVMGKMANADPSLLPTPPSNQQVEADNAANMTAWTSGTIPPAWLNRWENAGLTMPQDTKLTGRSMWQDLAKAAGIGDTELSTKVKDLAANHIQGNALTVALETFISKRYVALMKSQQEQAA